MARAISPARCAHGRGALDLARLPPESPRQVCRARCLSAVDYTGWRSGGGSSPMGGYGDRSDMSSTGRGHPDEKRGPLGKSAFRSYGRSVRRVVENNPASLPPFFIPEVALVWKRKHVPPIRAVSEECPSSLSPRPTPCHERGTTGRLTSCGWWLDLTTIMSVYLRPAGELVFFSGRLSLRCRILMWRERAVVCP